MSGISTDIIDLFYQLLPGFVAAWIFHGLTAHPKLSPFERIVQALIFTVIIQAVVIVLRESMFEFGLLFILGTWTDESRLIWSLIIAVAIGLLFSRLANYDTLHGWLRKWRWTARTGE